MLNVYITSLKDKNVYNFIIINKIFENKSETGKDALYPIDFRSGYADHPQ